MKQVIVLIGIQCVALAYGYPQWDFLQGPSSHALSMASTTLTRNPFLPIISPASGQITEKSSSHIPSRTRTTTKFRNPFLPNIPPASVDIFTDTDATKRISFPEISGRSDTCKGPDQKEGVCTTLLKCPSLLRRLQQDPSNSNFRSFLRESNQICGNEYAVVCCPSPSIKNEFLTRLPTTEEGCGYKKKPSGDDDTLRILVVGGTDSELGTWPWIALLGYSDGSSASPFKCGGALITSRHVLTAAHCIRSDLTFVRLGEHDLSTDTEARHIDVPISKVLRHPEYNLLDGRNDIALLYLERSVNFTKRIAPICLPITPELRRKSYVNRLPLVAGWGRTLEGGQPATVLQQLPISVYNNSVCANSYKKQNRLISQQQFNDGVICAGDLDGGKDTCQGDSGGPLMISETIDDNIHFFLIGVVSYGIGCARAEIPGVYSRVAYFIDWIQRGVANTP